MGNKGVYDPILITPKHYYNPSSSESHPNPDKKDSPVGYSNQNRRYFSGTVENCRGGDFCGYYFPSTSGLTSEFSENRQIHPTSTPGWDYNQTPLNSRYENVLEPRNLFPLKLRSTPSYTQETRNGENAPSQRTCYRYTLNEGYHDERGNPIKDEHSISPGKCNFPPGRPSLT